MIENSLSNVAVFAITEARQPHHQRSLLNEFSITSQLFFLESLTDS